MGHSEKTRLAVKALSFSQTNLVRENKSPAWCFLSLRAVVMVI